MSKQLLNTPSAHAFSITGLVDDAFNRIREVILQTGWAPVTRWAEAAVVAYVSMHGFFFLISHVSDVKV
jgi:cyclopropane-fatty-acyl-phospholipid synthase